jgi:hypothetical protein
MQLDSSKDGPAGENRRRSRATARIFNKPGRFGGIQVHCLDSISASLITRFNNFYLLHQ